MTDSEFQRKIAADLAAAGVRKGGILFVHSSLRSMGHVRGRPETVIRGLLEALGPDGTLMMPSLTLGAFTSAPPVFDVKNSPSNIGAIPEYFRTRAGTLRSINLRHSVCGIGAQAEEILEKHQLDDTPCGPNSPYRALRDRAGQILMLGCGLGPNTSMHGVEELVEPSYLFGHTINYRVILPDNREIVKTCRTHSFAGYLQRYDRIGALLEEEGLRVGKVLEATVHLLECRLMWEKALEALRREPFYFVDKITRRRPTTTPAT